ncbi:hypothetical protein CRENBAI_008978 [Crenichthys baileyi]|uniref:Uncharacterized protein n=1 Tax=Crenichthys baileyi TaxID=28760 RepID=A0AAV9QXV9_9TELE
MKRLVLLTSDLASLPELALPQQCGDLILAVDGVCTVANCVGRELAPHVKKNGGSVSRVPEKDKRGALKSRSKGGGCQWSAKGMGKTIMYQNFS